MLHTNADRVRSQILGCHLRVVGEDGGQRVRLATGFNGETLVPTDEEARASAEARERAEREKAEAAEAALSAERALRAALEAEIAELRAGWGKARNSKR